MQPLPPPVREAIEARGAGLTVLVLRLGAMGDIVRTLPAVRLLRRGLPHARIHWVAWETWARMLSGHADIDRTIGAPRRPLRSLLGVVSEVRAIRAELVLDFHGDLRTGILGALSGAAVRLGYEGHQQKEGNRYFTTHRVPARERRRSRVERNLDLVRALGLPAHPVPDAGIAIGDEAIEAGRAIVRAIAPAGRHYAVINPGASRRQAYKKPPAALLAGAAVALADQGVCPIVVCGPGEEYDAREVLDASLGRARLAPATSLKSLAALLAGARLFVGGDSGPLHLACGVGCPVVGLYGPTDPVVNTPWNVPFAALSPVGNVYRGVKREDRAANGFDGLTPGDVVRAVREVLGAPRGSGIELGEQEP